jgi:predicted glycosyltransferase
VTARDNAQTVQLAREHWSDVTVIGDESPAGRVLKGRTLARRAYALSRWARRHNPDVALSHNSYAQIVAAYMSHVPIVTAMDFEHQPANHLAFRLADRILVPAAMPPDVIARYGASGDKVGVYPGFKEEAYLGDFVPDTGILRRLGIGASEQPVVVLRTPPTRALYHRFANVLFPEILQALGRQRVHTVALVRHAEQRTAIEAMCRGNITVPDAAVDSRSLTYVSDLMIGAGGTMTREAALMGVPTMSAFAGTVPAVDRALERDGRLRRLRSTDELAGVGFRTGDPVPIAELRNRGDRILDTFVSAVEEIGVSRRVHRPFTSARR